MIQKKKQRKYHQGLHKITWHLRNMQQFHRTVGLVSARQKKRRWHWTSITHTNKPLHSSEGCTDRNSSSAVVCSQYRRETFFFHLRWFQRPSIKWAEKNVNCRRPLFCCHIATGCCFILPRIYICSRNLWGLSFSSLTFIYIFYGKRNNNFLPWERTTV